MVQDGCVFNPTIEVVTFSLCGWCRMGVLLPAFTHLGHERQDLLSPCNGMHACTDDFSLHSNPKEFWGNGVRAHVNSKGKIPLTGKNIRTGGSNPRRCIKQDSQPNTLPSYSRPHLTSVTTDDLTSAITDQVLHQDQTHRPVPYDCLLYSHVLKLLQAAFK